MKKYIIFNILSIIILSIFIAVFTPFVVDDIETSGNTIQNNNFESNVEKTQNIILSNFTNIHDKAILSSISIKNLFEKDLLSLSLIEPEKERKIVRNIIEKSFFNIYGISYSKTIYNKSGH